MYLDIYLRSLHYSHSPLPHTGMLALHLQK